MAEVQLFMAGFKKRAADYDSACFFACPDLAAILSTNYQRKYFALCDQLSEDRRHEEGPDGTHRHHLGIHDEVPMSAREAKCQLLFGVERMAK